MSDRGASVIGDGHLGCPKVRVAATPPLITTAEQEMVWQPR